MTDRPSRFSGAWTAIVTPFRNGAVDLPALRALVEWQISEGIDGLVACGCTGEAATLSREEHLAVIETVLDTASGRVPVIGGAGRNDTSATVALARDVAKLGVSGLLVITPYYNKPTPAGLEAHYSAVADAAGIPVMAYNVPGRTGTNMSPETVARIAGHPLVCAIKDAAGPAERVTAIRALSPIAVLSGDDALALAQIALGATGVVSVASNVAPAAVVEMVAKALRSDFEGARKINDRLHPLFGALFLETNPIPVKKALELMGRIGGDLRLPLTGMSPSLVPRLQEAMAAAGVTA
ncbi:4-hydroxy-tetrahydrodipicolinate synthase [Candidatus Fermentibacteria bacterium]|nr:4-hydroxy-tetrahydrodipicolinate synthase [Candidatus Fermentibacteria bacterium]